MNLQNWFMGVVEDDFDPEGMGRVKVRCYGYHNPDHELLPTRDLPYMQTIHPVTAGPAVGGIGTSPTPLLNSIVFGAFYDGNDTQDSVILGVLPGGDLSDSQYDPNTNFGFGTANVATGQGIPLADRPPSSNTGAFKANTGDSQRKDLLANEGQYPETPSIGSGSGQSAAVETFGNELDRQPTNATGTLVYGNRFSGSTRRYSPKIEIEGIIKDSAAAVGISQVLNLSGNARPGEGGASSGRHMIQRELEDGYKVGSAGDFILIDKNGKQIGTTAQYRENNPEGAKQMDDFITEVVYRLNYAGYGAGIGAGDNYMTDSNYTIESETGRTPPEGWQNNAGAIHIDAVGGTIRESGKLKGLPYGEMWGGSEMNRAGAMKGLEEAYARGEKLAASGVPPSQVNVKILPFGVEERTIAEISNTIISTFPKYPLPPVKELVSKAGTIEADYSGGTPIDDCATFLTWATDFGQGIITVHSGGNLPIRNNTILINKSLFGGTDPNTQLSMVVRDPQKLKLLSTRAGSPSARPGSFEQKLNQGEFIAFNLEETGEAAGGGLPNDELSSEQTTTGTAAEVPSFSTRGIRNSPEVAGPPETSRGAAGEVISLPSFDSNIPFGPNPLFPPDPPD